MENINFTQIDAQTIWADMLQSFEEALNEKLESTDERRIFLQQEFQIILALYHKINFAGRMSLLRFAEEEFLDAFGENTGVSRLLASFASTTLKFSIQSPQTGNVIVPIGTKAKAAQGETVFSTTKIGVIKAGSLNISVPALAASAGNAANGLRPGEVSILVDPIPYISQVENETTTAGGANKESDASYRERIKLSMAQTSTAGASDSYKYWASTANPDIIDVSVSSPAKGEVLVIPLLTGGRVPEQEVLNDVLETLNQKEIRPITDFVKVEQPKEKKFVIDFDYYANSLFAGDVQNAVVGAGGAIDKYALWQCSKLSENINPDYLRALLFEVGVSRVEIRSPLYTDVEKTEIASENIDMRIANYIEGD